jgi:hypothetical protein
LLIALLARQPVPRPPPVSERALARRVATSFGRLTQESNATMPTARIAVMTPRMANWTSTATTVRNRNPNAASQHDQSTRPRTEARYPPGLRLSPR